jgi:hypothetical protein
MTPADRLDGLGPLDLLRVTRIAGMAAIRKGDLTTRQMRAIDRIVDKANERKAAKKK